MLEFNIDMLLDGNLLNCEAADPITIEEKLESLWVAPSEHNVSEFTVFILIWWVFKVLFELFPLTPPSPVMPTLRESSEGP